MKVIQRAPGIVPYADALAAMQAFTAARSATSADEFWTLEHPPVFTLGRAGKREHILAPGDIPVVESDRGGQVTYHGPGQLVIYTLLDTARLGIGPRELVRRLEQGVIDYLHALGISATRRSGAPGVYVGEAKIAALGLRIRQRCCYHGIALNVAMDRSPYRRINPCGYAGLQATDLEALGGPDDVTDVTPTVLQALWGNLYPDATITAQLDPALPPFHADNPLEAVN